MKSRQSGFIESIPLIILSIIAVTTIVLTQGIKQNQDNRNRAQVYGTRYSCNDGKCEVNPNGGYENLNACSVDCKAVVTPRPSNTPVPQCACPNGCYSDLSCLPFCKPDLSCKNGCIPNSQGGQCRPDPTPTKKTYCVEGAYWCDGQTSFYCSNELVPPTTRTCEATERCLTNATRCEPRYKPTATPTPTTLVGLDPGVTGTKYCDVGTVFCTGNTLYTCTNSFSPPKGTACGANATCNAAAKACLVKLTPTPTYTPKPTPTPIPPTPTPLKFANGSACRNNEECTSNFCGETAPGIFRCQNYIAPKPQITQSSYCQDPYQPQFSCRGDVSLNCVARDKPPIEINCGSVGCGSDGRCNDPANPPPTCSGATREGICNVLNNCRWIEAEGRCMSTSDNLVELQSCTDACPDGKTCICPAICNKNRVSTAGAFDRSCGGGRIGAGSLCEGFCVATNSCTAAGLSPASGFCNSGSCCGSENRLTTSCLCAGSNELGENVLVPINAEITGVDSKSYVCVHQGNSCRFIENMNYLSCAGTCFSGQSSCTSLGRSAAVGRCNNGGICCSNTRIQQSCTPGSKICSFGSALTCDNLGAGFTEVVCKQGEMCQDGACIDKVSVGDACSAAHGKSVEGQFHCCNGIVKSGQCSNAIGEEIKNLPDDTWCWYGFLNIGGSCYNCQNPPRWDDAQQKHLCGGVKTTPIPTPTPIPLGLHGGEDCRSSQCLCETTKSLIKLNQHCPDNPPPTLEVDPKPNDCSTISRESVCSYVQYCAWNNQMCQPIYELSENSCTCKDANVTANVNDLWTSSSGTKFQCKLNRDGTSCSFTRIIDYTAVHIDTVHSDEPAFQDAYELAQKIEDECGVSLYIQTDKPLHREDLVPIYQTCTRLPEKIISGPALGLADYQITVNPDSGGGLTNQTGVVTFGAPGCGPGTGYTQNQSVKCGYATSLIVHEILHNRDKDQICENGVCQTALEVFTEVSEQSGIIFKSPESPTCIVSGEDFLLYSQHCTNETEGFAISGAAYYLAPEKLKEEQPAVYEFYKNHVFDGVEYIEVPDRASNCTTTSIEIKTEESIQRATSNRAACIGNL